MYAFGMRIFVDEKLRNQILIVDGYWLSLRTDYFFKSTKNVGFRFDKKYY